MFHLIVLFRSNFTESDFSNFTLLILDLSITSSIRNSREFTCSTEHITQLLNVNNKKVSIKEKFIFTSKSNYILYIIYKLVMSSKSLYKFIYTNLS